MGNSRIIRSVFTGVLVGLLLAIAFGSGLLADEILENANAMNISEDSGYPLLIEVETILDRVYLREQPDDTIKQYGAIRGILATLSDPNTFFIEPPVAQSEADALAGTYGGIGVQLRLSEQAEWLMTPFDDSPAKNAGVDDGDKLIAINNNQVSSQMQLDELDQQLRGEVKSGNGVEITFYSIADDREVTTFIEFDVINVPSVIWRILPEDNRIGYVLIMRFTNRTPSEFLDAVNSFRQSEAQGVILDIRNNSGGLLDEAIEVASQFFQDGVIIYEETATSSEPYVVEEGGTLSDLPIVVLVNNRTASAAEIVAGAIRDRDRGVLIGQQTFGKGTVQQIFSLSDGSSIHVTSAEWFTPNRTPLDGEGLKPNIEMIPDSSGRDVELGEAIRTLQANFEERKAE